MKINIPISSVLFLLVANLSFGQNIALPLWPDGKIPNWQKSDGVERRDSTDAVRIHNIQKPDIAVYLPSKRIATGQAVIICPGGGYNYLAYDLEGSDVAKFFNAKGLAAIVLKYRPPVSSCNIIGHKSPLLDAQRAIRLVRYHSAEWHIDSNKIGIMGFSAGGHLASTAGTHFDAGEKNAADPVESMSSRPDFMILIYPVITMSLPYTHQGSREALLGKNPGDSLIQYFSNELHVTQNTPPVFIVHADDDNAVPVENSLLFYQALRKNGISTEMHIYPKGGHGFALALDKGCLETWPDRCIDWLRGLDQ